MSGKYQIVKTHAGVVGECMSCGCGKRGAIVMYTFKIGLFRANLCLNCLKVLRIEIQHVLEFAASEELRSSPPSGDARGTGELTQ